FFLYGRHALAVASGLVSRDDYLRQQAQEYQPIAFVNHALTEESTGEGGRAAVFFRHLYYLHVPFVDCDPDASWAIDPTKLQQPEEWLALFREQRVRWVVRSGEYPDAVAAPLRALETSGSLQKMNEADIGDIQGFRIAGQRGSVHVVILAVKEPGKDGGR